MPQARLEKVHDMQHQKKWLLYAYRKFLFPAGASTTVNPIGESVQDPECVAVGALDAGHDNGWIVLLVKVSAGLRMQRFNR
jgi:hypothetical protein